MIQRARELSSRGFFSSACFFRARSSKVIADVASSYAQDLVAVRTEIDRSLTQQESRSLLFEEFLRKFLFAVGTLRVQLFLS